MKKVYLVIDRDAEPSIIRRVSATLKLLHCEVYCYTHDENGDKEGDYEWEDEHERNIMQADFVIHIANTHDFNTADALKNSPYTTDYHSYQRLKFAIENLCDDYSSDEHDADIEDLLPGKNILTVHEAKAGQALYVSCITHLRSSGEGDETDISYGNVHNDGVCININNFISPKQIPTGYVMPNGKEERADGKLRVYISKSNLADSRVYNTVRTNLRKFDVDIVEWDMTSPGASTGKQYLRMNACDLMLVIPPTSTLSFDKEPKSEYKLGKGQHDMIVNFENKSRLYVVGLSLENAVAIHSVHGISIYESGDWKDNYAEVQYQPTWKALSSLIIELIDKTYPKNPVPTDEAGQPIVSVSNTLHLGTALILNIKI
jgi:hypothetical protein